ncbi:MAG TPA: hypothetical protein VGD35_15715, partial [Chitinophaga sp.]
EATEISLPQTQIRGFISTTTFRIIPGAGDGHGVVPTHPVIPAITDILMGRDVAKVLALKLIDWRGGRPCYADLPDTSAIFTHMEKDPQGL